MREQAIEQLQKIPITETQIYDDARQKIARCSDDINASEETKLRSRFAHAVRAANEADTASSDWVAITGHWGEASRRLREVTPENSRYEEAQQKITEYAGYRDSARNKLFR